MLTAFEICKAAYPGIPDAILNEYAELLPLVALHGEANNSAKDFYENKIDIQPNWLAGYVASKSMIYVQFLYPTNQQYIITEKFFWRAIPLENGSFFFEIPGDVRYDKRLFSGVQNNPNILPITKTLSVVKKTYIGLQSIIALHENGYSMPDVNYEKAYSFLTYVNAYKKFSTEIDSERAYLQREAEAQLASYRQDYTDRAQREKSDLQSKKIQMLMAIDNDTKAATRDFQNMLLNAQNLKQNLRGQIG